MSIHLSEGELLRLLREAYDRCAAIAAFHKCDAAELAIHRAASRVEVSVDGLKLSVTFGGIGAWDADEEAKP